MAIFSNGFKTAKFINPPKNTLIEIIYQNKNEKQTSYLIEVDNDNQDFIDLLEIVSLEDIENLTYGRPLSNKKVKTQTIPKNVEKIKLAVETENVQPIHTLGVKSTRKKASMGKTKTAEVEKVENAVNVLQEFRYDESVIFPFKVRLFKNKNILNSGLKRDIEESKDLLHLISILQHVD